MLKQKFKILPLAIILLVLTQAGLLCVLFVFDSSKKTSAFQPIQNIKTMLIEKSEEKKDLPVHYSYNMSKTFFEEAYDNKKKNFQSKEMIYGGIVPHHLFVKEYIASFFDSLEKQKYKKVILIGPNHFNAGKSNILLSEALWKTPYGDLRPDQDLASKLVKTGTVQIDEYPFIKEHSISGLVGFIRKSLGDVEILPIIIKSDTQTKDIERLSKAIAKNTDSEETLVLSSVDFSHYMPENVAEFHDQKSNEVILDFDFERVKDLEVDSPLSLLTLLEYLSLIEAKKGELIFHTNSGTISGKSDEPTTSHNFFTFKKGEAKKSNLISFLFFGDLMIDRYVGTLIDKNGFPYLIDDLAGEEKRFFQGIDIIGANLEGAVTVDGEHYPPVKTHDFAFEPENVKTLKDYNFNFFNLSNNHYFDQGSQGIEESKTILQDFDINFSGNAQRELNEESYTIMKIAGKKIAMAGMNISAGPIDESKIKSFFEKLDKVSDFLVLNIHWGAEYSSEQSEAQVNLAHSLIDSGVDLIVGHHPHVVQGIEIYQGKAIFYSLGNFIFDQYFSEETQVGLAVGINHSSSTSLYLFPIASRQSSVELLKNEKKWQFFDKLVALSNLSEEQEKSLKTGNITIK